MNTSVFITGGSSQIGFFLIPHLIAAGYKVQALSRQGLPGWLAPSPLLQWAVSTTDNEIFFKLEEQVEHFISTGPLALTIKCIQRLPNLKHLIAMSTSSVLTKLDSESESERLQINAIKMSEDHLHEQCKLRGVRLVILRPTLIYGAGLDRNLCLAAKLLRRFGVFPLASHANGLRQPVHAEDLAKICIALLKNHVSGIYNMPGASKLSFDEMLSTVAQTVAYGRLLRLPIPVLSAGLGLAHGLGRCRSLNTSMFTRQRQDLVFDMSASEKTLGWSPRKFSLTPIMLTPPTRPLVY